MAMQEPRKKKRKRTFDEYDEITSIIDKLGTKYDSSLFACFEYIKDRGVFVIVLVTQPQK